MAENTHEDSHGDSVASWTAVSIIMVASVIGTFAFWFDQPAIVIASAVLAVAGIPVGMIMKKMGYGVDGSKSKSKH